MLTVVIITRLHSIKIITQGKRGAKVLFNAHLLDLNFWSQSTPARPHLGELGERQRADMQEQWLLSVNRDRGGAVGWWEQT